MWTNVKHARMMLTDNPLSVLVKKTNMIVKMVMNVTLVMLRVRHVMEEATINACHVMKELIWLKLLVLATRLSLPCRKVYPKNQNQMLLWL